MGLTFYKPLRIIEVDLPDTSIDMQSLINDVRDWEDELENMEVYELIAGAGKEELGGGVSVGLTITLKGWRLKFADRPGPDWVVCDVAGGNLTCVTGTDEEIRNMSGITYVNPIAPAAYVTVTKTSSSSATALEQSAIEFASFQNRIWVDFDRGTTGTDYPIGTRETPSNNFIDSKNIAEDRGIYDLFFLDSTTTISNGDNISGYMVWGRYHDQSVVRVESGADITNVQFNEVSLTGDLNSNFCVLQRGALRSVDNANINVYYSELGGDVKLDLGSFRHWIGCRSNQRGNIPTLDFDNAEQELVLTDYVGNLKVSNMSGGALYLYGNACQLEIDSGCVSGNIWLNGDISYVDNSNGASMIITGTTLGEERLTVGNRAIKFVMATGDIATRNVSSGMIDYMTIKYKNDGDLDWSSPRREQNLYYWYENLGDEEPIEVKEDG